MIKVITVTAKVKEEGIELFVKIAKRMVHESLSEKGCLTYKITKNIIQENEFFFYEKYENEEALQMHNSSNHFNEFMSLVIPLLAKEPIIESFDA